MKHTYTRTTFMTNEMLQKATVKMYLYNVDKYTEEITEEKLWKYTGLTAWDIIEGGAEAETIEVECDEASIDPHHEYLVLHFNDGSQATFRNSCCDMFIK